MHYYLNTTENKKQQKAKKMLIKEHFIMFGTPFAKKRANSDIVALTICLQHET
jgi:hypothetical protein